MKRRTVLCVFAHPDDESFVAGGSIARFAAAGHRVVLVTCTGGEASTQVQAQRLTERSMRRVRTNELRRSCQILGITRMHILNYPDRNLNQIPMTRLVRRITFFLRKYDPDVVFTFAPDGATNHSDHKVVSRITTNAVRRWSKLGHEISVHSFSFSNSFRRKVGLPTVKYERFKRTDISKFVGKKLKAMFQYHSQIITLNRIRNFSRTELSSLCRYEYFLAEPHSQV